MATFNLPRGGMLGGSVRVIGKEAIEGKLAKAEVNILRNNLAMVTEMLVTVKAEVIPQIPLGPGRLGPHLRDTFRVDVKPGVGQLGTKVTGVVRSAVQGYWREFGTGARHRSSGRRRRGVGGIVFGAGSLGSGGERAFMTAHHALSGIRKFINVYYGGLARWWHL